MSDPVRWGILGTGGINDRFLKNIRDATSARFVAVGSRSGDRARAFAARHDVPTAHGSYEGLLDDPDVEVVYICLPNGLHHEWTMRALDAGKHVLCEKPYTRHPAEAVEAFDAAEAAGLVLMEAFMYRHHPQTATIERLVQWPSYIDPVLARVRLRLCPVTASDGDDVDLARATGPDEDLPVDVRGREETEPHRRSLTSRSAG